MSKVVRRRWNTYPGTGMSRRDRMSCEYEAYVPDELMGRPIRLDGDVAAEAAEAEAALTHLDTTAASLADTEALARLLLRAEAVASSRIEGLEIGGRRLLHAEAAQSLGDEARDVTAEEVLNNIDAMRWIVDVSTAAATFHADHLLQANARLLAGTRLEERAGRSREEQHWIGGSDYNPCSASFVPPPPEFVPGLLDDLAAFCNTDSLPAVAQAALAHAQFETIHPFIDGNGRTGRALIHVVLRRRGVVNRVLPPVSLVLATLSRDYVNGLTATRYRGPASSSAASEGVNTWIAFFAAACKRAVEDAGRFEQEVVRVQQRWREKLGGVRRGSAVEALLTALPGAPVLTVNGAADLVGRSFQAANEAMARLAEAGIVRQINVGRERGRAFEAPDVIDAFTRLERRLASPVGDTRRRPPARPTPRRAR